jgi:DNA-binding CsgD family transcriptional regulator
MKAETDRIAHFSAAVALIYETIVGDAQRAAVEQAVCALVDADEIVFTCQRTGPSALLAPYGGTTGEELDDKNETVQDRDGRPAPHVLSLDIVDRGYDKLRLIVVRHPRRAPFTDRDLAWLSLLQVHLQNAEFVKSLLPEGVLGSAASSHLVRTMSQGLIIVSADCEILWSNPSAQDILAAQQGLSNVNGRLRAARVFESTRIEMLIREAARGRPGVMLVEQASMWLPYGLAFSPLDIDAMPASALSRPIRPGCVLVAIKDMRRHIDAIAARLTDVFGFTKAEQQIAALLLAGKSLADAAIVLEKSLSTVKKQLRSMLTKTGTRNQAELLSMFLSVPSLI